MDSGSITNRSEGGRVSPSFSDVLFQNERAMWRAEFDSVGQDTVLSFVEHNCYPPTGMEVARQWLEERGVRQSRVDVQPLADGVQATAPDFLDSTQEELISRLDADCCALIEIATNAKKTARKSVFIASVASLLALCAIVMVLASSRRGEPNAKQASGEPPRPAQPVVRPRAPTLSPAEVAQVSTLPPENTQKEQQSNPSPIISPDFKPEGHTVAEALALIADKVGGEGAIAFSALVHDIATGRDHIEQLSYKASNVTIDPNRCQVGYRWHVNQNGAVYDQDRTVNLRLAKSIRVTSIDAEPSHRFVMHADPKVYVVHVARWDNSSGDHLYFREADMAARVATATRRAVALCDNEKRQFRGR